MICNQSILIFYRIIHRCLLLIGIDADVVFPALDTPPPKSFALSPVIVPPVIVQVAAYELLSIAPPFHVHCHSTTVPYFDDEFDAVGERAARDEETGKTYFVPGNMTYKEWEKSFVNGEDKSGLQAVKKDDTVELKKKIANADVEIADLKKQFSDTTDGYSYDDWFKDFNSIEDGYGDVTEADEPNVNILKNIQQKIQDLIQKKNQ